MKHSLDGKCRNQSEKEAVGAIREEKARIHGRKEDAPAPLRVTISSRYTRRKELLSRDRFN